MPIHFQSIYWEITIMLKNRNVKTIWFTLRPLGHTFIQI